MGSNTMIFAVSTVVTPQNVLSMSMSTYIYIAHKRKTSNALYVLVRTEHIYFIFFL